MSAFSTIMAQVVPWIANELIPKIIKDARTPNIEHGKTFESWISKLERQRLGETCVALYTGHRYEKVSSWVVQHKRTYSSMRKWMLDMPVKWKAAIYSTHFTNFAQRSERFLGIFIPDGRAGTAL